MTTRLGLVAAAMLVFLGACGATTSNTATAPSDVTQAAFLAVGAEAISAVDLIVGDSVSIQYPGGTVTYSTNGAKIWRTNDGAIVEREWARRADGIICEETVGSGETVCNDQQRLLRLGDDIRQFSEEGVLQFTISTTGNGTYTANEA